MPFVTHSLMAHQIALEAELLRCGFDVGYYEKRDIERWADKQIAAIDNPRAELLDLSMLRQVHPHDVMNKLKSLASSAPSSSTRTRIGFVGLALNRKRISLTNAIRLLDEMTSVPGVTEEEASRIYCLDDARDLAIAGISGNLADVERELHNFLSPYADELAAGELRFLPLQE